MPDDAGKGDGDALTSLGSALTSPAKLAFAGLVLLVYKGALCGVSFRKFVWIAVMFIVAQIFHDDFFRIGLNRWADRCGGRGWSNQDGTKGEEVRLTMWIMPNPGSLEAK